MANQGMKWGLTTLMLAITLTCATKANAQDARVVQANVLAKAFDALGNPEYCGQYLNVPLHPTRGYLPYDFYKGCPDAIDFLVRTAAAVDNDLLRLAKTDNRLRVRFRAVSILAERRNEAVIPLIERMSASKDADERYVVWNLYRQAIEEGKLPRPKDVTGALVHYGEEKDQEIREEIEWFFGAAKAQAAVNPLLEMLKCNPGSSPPAVWALGEIGDKRAVQALIKDFPESINQHFHLQALGKLPTVEAVDFIIAHLDRYMAVKALYMSKSEKALPALEKNLTRLRQKKDPDEINLAATHIAIVRLTHADPREALLAIAADRQEDHQARWDAFSALREYETKPYKGRILNVYRTDKDNDIKRICIWLLEDSNHEGIPEAMMDHAIASKVESKSDMATEYCLLKALNRRLDTSFREMSEMRTYVQSLQERKKK